MAALNVAKSAPVAGSAYRRALAGSAAAAPADGGAAVDERQLATALDPQLAARRPLGHPGLPHPHALLAYPAAGCWKRRKQLLPQRSPLS